ncbi:hypothetical protein [Pseudomonas syringae group genomosp. 3]|uniref:hypothetical protein n=1 Tax=Pseudomonas syringae group genomosp. 3 TaxID=251701 RepID=UPI000F00A05B|nr:hypothetical protein [Pseudomonas syringae group genomosp. 3]
MDHHALRQKVIDQFIRHWSNARPENAKTVVEHLTNLYDKFHSHGLTDRIFEKEITSGDINRYTQRTAELLLADMLWQDGFTLRSENSGPDFRATKNGFSAWIELHTPEPKGIPVEYFQTTKEPIVKGVPFDEISLRWTAAFSEKKSKLRGYLESGIVKPSDPYVIAINAHLLSRRPFHGLNGVSGKPVPVEILFSVGPRQIHIDRMSGTIVDQSHAHRPSIPKAGSVNKVPADSFLDPENISISAVLGVDLLEQTVLKAVHPSAVVYNPQAINPIPLNWLSAQEQWACKMELEDYSVYKL